MFLDHGTIFVNLDQYTTTMDLKQQYVQIRFGAHWRQLKGYEWNSTGVKKTHVKLPHPRRQCAFIYKQKVAKPAKMWEARVTEKMQYYYGILHNYDSASIFVCKLISKWNVYVHLTVAMTQ